MPQPEQPVQLDKQDQQQFLPVRRTEGNVTVSRARFRDQRLFHVAEPNGIADGWYFEIREGAAQGPYINRRLAEAVLAHYIESACKN